MKSEEGSGISLRNYVTLSVTGRPNTICHYSKTVKFEVIYVCAFLLFFTLRSIGYK